MYADVHVDTDVDKGEVVDCEECGVKLEVVAGSCRLDLVEEDSLDETMMKMSIERRV